MKPILPFDAELVELAYRQGLFPMGEPNSDEILWFRPDPRAIIPLENFHCSRSLARTIRRETFRWTIDQCFEKVMRHCAGRSEGNWITEPLIRVYTELHWLGKAHSLEVWRDGELAGGIYGVALGGAFFGESKFHAVRDASKVALYQLVQHLRHQGFTLLEVQFVTPHLAQFGAREIPGRDYLQMLNQALSLPRRFKVAAPPK